MYEFGRSTLSSRPANGITGGKRRSPEGILLTVTNETVRSSTRNDCYR
ncbi:hypothetical protein NJ7G_1941 [Natrinema sp. J7-2]|nr:hypothetical protein NJ7G_1941 [Natrinema sp. J7-2]